MVLALDPFRLFLQFDNPVVTPLTLDSASDLAYTQQSNSIKFLLIFIIRVSMEKKAKEKKIYGDIMMRARLRGGESRRIVDKIKGEAMCDEHPDFIVSPSKLERGCQVIIAIEHFRVDHFSELNKKRGHQDSIAAKERNHAFEVQKKWGPILVNDDIPQGALDDIGASVARCIEAKFQASFMGYLQSFVDNLQKHASKTGVYREEVRTRIGHDGPIKMALLVELHSDFSECFLHEGFSCRKPIPGTLLIFEEMIKELEKLKNNVDFVLLGSYPALQDEIVDAAAINLGSLRNSLKRNKLSVIQYLGEDKKKAFLDSSHIVLASAEPIGDKIDLPFMREGGMTSYDERAKVCTMLFPQVIRAYKEKKRPFLITPSMQMLLDVFSRELEEDTGRIGSNSFDCFGQDEIDSRFRRFEERYR